MSPWIVHIDMDSFFVSVERLKNPSLNNKPVAVGGSGPRSVISSASYEARKFGVHSAMPSAMALRLCPNLILVSHSFSDYSEISEKIFSKISSTTPIFQKISIDEAYLDMSGCEKLYKSKSEFGKYLKSIVLESSGLPCSIGMGTNKMIAKIASTLSKPNGLLEIIPGQEKVFMAPLPIDKIPGIGKKSAIYLNSKGIKTCNDLANKTDDWLQKNLNHWGAQWRAEASGISNSKVETEWNRKSLSVEETFIKDRGEIEFLKKVMIDLAEEVCFDLRRENFISKTIQIKLRYPDFTTCTRSITLKEATNQTAEIAENASRLLMAHKIPHLPLRLLGLQLSGLSDKNEKLNQPVQLDLFSDFSIAQDIEEKKLKRSKLDEAKDALKIKFGKDIFLAQIDKTIKTK